MENRTTERYIRNIKRVANQTLGEFSSNEDLSYYINLYRKAFCNFEKTNDEYIGSYCVMIPDELIYAFGYKPLRLCAGHQIAAMIGDEIIPRDACPVVKATAGFHAMQVLPMYNRCKLAILPLTCEGKRKSAEVLSEFLPIVPVPMPMSKGNIAFQETVDNMKALSKTIEQVTGRKLSNLKLIKACKAVNKAQKEAFNLQKHLYHENPQIKGSEVMMILNSFCYASPKKWAEKTKKINFILNKKEKYAKSLRKPKPRIFIAGSPISFPNFKLPFLIEELNAQIIGDESCLAGRLMYDPVVPIDYSTDGILRALTARYTAACTCPVFENIEDRICSLTQRMELSNAEGIIYHVLRGCTPYDFELTAIEKWAEQRDIPVLRVETDFSTEDIEQVKIRFEAFAEMIEQRRKRNV